MLKIHLSSDTCTSRPPPGLPTPVHIPRLSAITPLGTTLLCVRPLHCAFDLLDPYSRVHDATALGILQKDSYLPPVPPCLLLVTFLYLQPNSPPHTHLTTREREIVGLDPVILPHHPAILINITNNKYPSGPPAPVSPETTVLDSRSAVRTRDPIRALSEVRQPAAYVEAEPGIGSLLVWLALENSSGTC